jgi:hypothetical protein
VKEHTHSVREMGNDKVWICIKCKTEIVLPDGTHPNNITMSSFPKTLEEEKVAKCRHNWIKKGDSSWVRAG